MRRTFDPVTLKLFVAVCEERNIARAGDREAIVASAISKRVAAIEEELGVRLLKRGRRGIEPTAAGEAFLRHAREVLNLMERMHAEIGEFASGVQGSVRVFASLSVLSETLPDDIGSFLAEHRTVRISLEERVSSEIVRGVLEGQADLGICWDAGDLEGLQTRAYRKDHLCVVLPTTHALAGRKRVAFAETLGFDQIEILAGGLVQTQLRRAAALAGRELRYRILVSTFDAACRNVAAGLGIAIVPREASEAQASALGLRLVTLADAWAVRRFVIGTRPKETLSAPARLLADFLHERASNAA